VPIDHLLLLVVWKLFS